MEKPEPITMRGSLTVNDSFSSWTIKKVIAIDDNGLVIGEAIPSLNDTDLVWTMEAVTKENTPGVFWVEMADMAGRMFYNEGMDVMFRSDGYYDLPVTTHYIPVGSASALAKIGRDELYPREGVYTLIRDIGLRGAWEPLCKDSMTAFSGVFDGHDYTIRGIFLPDNSVWQNIGLFGCIIGDGTNPAKTIIRNLNLEIVNRELRVSAVSEQSVGVLAGYVMDAAIDRVTVNGPVGGLIIRKSGGGDFYAGGLAGRILGEPSMISRSAALFSVEADVDGTGSGYLGGIAGYCGSTGGAGGTASVIIEKSYSAGLIVLNKKGGSAYAGGLIGCHQTSTAGNAIITECFASGNVSVSGSGGTLAAGGLTGGSDINAAPGLVIDRSCALMEAVTASSETAPVVSAGGLSGHQLADSSSTFQLDSVEIKTPAASSVNAGLSVNRSSLGGSWFGEAPLQWDFAETWQWDADVGRLRFQWQPNGG
jgi:hypothetical protein